MRKKEGGEREMMMGGVVTKSYNFESLKILRFYGIFTNALYPD